MPDGASISQLRMSSIIEVTRGTTPTTPAYTILPIRQGSFMQVDKNFEQTTLIRSDREPGTRVGGVAGCSGNISMPLVRENGFEQWLESALSGAFAAVTRSSISVTFAATGDTITRATGSWLTEAPANRFEVGDIIFPAGTTSNQTLIDDAGDIDSSVTTITVDSTANYLSAGVIKIDSEIITYTGKTGTTFTGCTRGAYGTTAAAHLDNAPVLQGLTITAITATVITCGGHTLADEGPVSTSFTTTTRVLVPGTTRAFYSIDQYFSDIDYYEIFKGAEVNTAQFTMPTSGEVGVEFAVLGTSYATGQVASSTYVATAGRTPFAASTEGSELLVDGTAAPSCIESINFTINNNRSLKYGVGEQFACFVEEGTREINLTFSTYLVDDTFQAKFQAETRMALKTRAVSADGDQFMFVWPRLVITAAPKQITGQTVAEAISASAEYSATDGASFWVREMTLA